jgi:putative endonuclease
MAWTVYILECADKTLYTGITKDMSRRLTEHTNGAGAKYTRGRGPLKIIYTELRRTKGQALKREAKIKSLKRPEKLALAAETGA